jgi:hypothetical protein
MKTQIQDKSTEGSLPITIHYGSQRDGYTFRLRPLTLLAIREKYPDRYRVDSVFIGFDKHQDLTQFHESVWGHIGHLLTGLSSDELNNLGGFIVVNPVTNQKIYHSLLVHA